jgi:predicted lipase
MQVNFRKFCIDAKLKPYKVQEMVFSCLRSKIAYENPSEIKNIFKKNGNRDIFSCKLMSCNNEIKSRVDKVVDNIIDDMHSPILNELVPKFYDGNDNKEKRKDSQGYMIWKSNTIYITFRGTKDIHDVIDAIDIRPKKLMRDIYVHTGFSEQFFSIEPKITQDIKDVMLSFPIERIIFTGHSMGGGMAAIAAAYYASMFKYIHITCHTFGIPLIGNNEFVKWFERGVDECIRLEIEEDLVPYVPINETFKHIPDGVRLKKSGSIDNFYEIEPLNYANFINKILKKEEMRDIVLNHSCERYIERLLSLKHIRKDIIVKEELIDKYIKKK